MFYLGESAPYRKLSSEIEFSNSFGWNLKRKTHLNVLLEYVTALLEYLDLKSERALASPVAMPIVNSIKDLNIFIFGIHQRAPH